VGTDIGVDTVVVVVGMADMDTAGVVYTSARVNWMHFLAGENEVGSLGYPDF